MKKSKVLSILLVFLAVISFVVFFITRNNQEYKIIFDSNGGSIVENQKVKYHQHVIKPIDPIRENYFFVGWLNNGILYDFNNNVEENILLTASWKEKESFVVTISLDGVGYESKFYDGSLINIENFVLPPKDGYHIVLYNNGQQFDLTKPITSNLNLVAQYEKNS